MIQNPACAQVPRLVPLAQAVDDPVAAELDWLAQADAPVAALWQTGPSLIVPRSYRRQAEES